MTKEPRRSVASFGEVLARARAVPGIGVYLGLMTVVVGGVLIAIAWGKVAGITDVGLQTPYLVSAGLPGLALVVVGLSVVSHASRSRDARARSAQLQELSQLLVAIAAAVETNAGSPSAARKRRRASVGEER